MEIVMFKGNVKNLFCKRGGYGGWISPLSLEKIQQHTARIATPHLDEKREKRNPGSIKAIQETSVNEGKASFQLGLCSETDNRVEMVGGGTVKQPMKTWEKKKKNSNELPFEHAHQQGQDEKTKANQTS